MKPAGLSRAALLRWLRAPGTGDLDDDDPAAWDRCRLRALATRHHLGRLALQPLSCALFPLVLVETSSGRLLLSLVTTENYRLLGHRPPRCYPCLSEASLPPLVQTLRGDLTLLLGPGLARALWRAGSQAVSDGGAPGSRASR